jgi:hypothetical protein
MANAHIVFTDISTSVKWDTDCPLPVLDGEEFMPPEGSEPYRSLIQHGVENIWGNRCVWKRSARYDTGQVVETKRDGTTDTATGQLLVQLR